MPYFSQAMKKEIAPAIKAVLKKHNVKGSISVKNHSKLEVNVKSGDLKGLDGENIGFWSAINGYDDLYDKAIKCFVNELFEVMEADQREVVYDGDYGSVPNYYTVLNIGSYAKPFQYVGA